MSLLNEIGAIASVRYRSTKAEIIDYYQGEYPARGRGSWKSTLVSHLSAFTGVKPKSLEKRFDTQRRGNVEPRNAEQYREFGKLLPPIVTIPPFDVHFKGKIKISRKWYPRNFTVHVGTNGLSFDGYTLNIDNTGSQQFLNDGWEGWLFLAYFKGDELAEDWQGQFTITL